MCRTSRVVSLMIAVVASLSLAGAASAAEPVKPLKALLVLGGCCHDYAAQSELLAKGLAERAHVEVTVAYDPDRATTHLNPVYEKPDWARGFDVVIHDECTSDVKDLALVERILEPHRQGLPAVLLHCGMHSYRTEGYPKAVTPWFEFTGLQSTGHGPQTPIEIKYAASDSAITRGLAGWTTINEELYNNSEGKLLDTATALARGTQSYKNRQGQDTTAESVVVWTNNYRDKTRVFATTLGHNTQTVADGRYLDLVTRGLLWSCDKLDGTYLKAAK
ncbi:MAG: ThuA domain-containing protein [Planctomycetaceae bacterium]|nr:ThuA domain-containing protein [Planctomycetaceae bacterium]